MVHHQSRQVVSLATFVWAWAPIDSNACRCSAVPRVHSMKQALVHTASRLQNENIFEQVRWFERDIREQKSSEIAESAFLGRVFCTLSFLT